MSSPAQRKATQNYRSRLAQQGIIRFEVQAPETDHALLRALARRLASGGTEAHKARLSIEKILAGEPSKAGAASPPPRHSSQVEKQPDFGDLFGER